MWLRRPPDRRRPVRRLSAAVALAGWICAFELVPALVLGHTIVPRAVSQPEVTAPATPTRAQRPYSHDAYNITHHRAALVPTPVWQAPLVLERVEPIDPVTNTGPRPVRTTSTTAQPRAPPANPVCEALS